MKIAYIHTGDWPSNSPSTTFATYNCIGLSKYAEKCHFFIKRNSADTSKKVLNDNFNIESPQNLIIHQIKKPFIRSNHFYYRKVYKKLLNIHKSEKFDAVITRNITFLPYLVKLKENHSIKIYFESHDFFTDLTLRNDINTSKKIKQSKIENEFIPKLTGLICLQKTQKQLYSRYFPKLDIQVFRTGVLEYVKSELEKKYITYIGSLDKLKGVETLIESLKYTRTNPKLLIIGGKNKNEINKINSVIKNLVPKADISITGWINKKDLDLLLRETKIGIVPLKDTFFNRYLTSPLKLFDYYSYGVPVIASDLPTTRELIIENQSGSFFIPEDAKDLAKKIDSLLRDDNKISEMNSYIYKNTSYLFWENRGKNIIEWIKGHE